jgi:uncharacterized Zn finger protein (UPF0148 family)
MDYLTICPRCKFKVSTNKHFCPTCGLKMQAAANKQDKPIEHSTIQPATKSSFWTSFFGLDGNSDKEVDQTQEKPAW